MAHEFSVSSQATAQSDFGFGHHACWPIYADYGFRHLLPWLTCTDWIRAKFGSGGLDFEIFETDCEGTINVLVFRGDGSKSTIFTYVPLHYDDESPRVVFHPDENRIEISVNTIRWANVKASQWGNVKIDYRIGKVERPELGDVD